MSKTASTKLEMHEALEKTHTAAKIAAVKSGANTTKKIGKKTAKQPLASIVKLSPKVRTGGLDPEAVLINNTSKIARAADNAERHLNWDGKTVRQVLESRQGDARDINYDLKKGFMTLRA